MTYNKSTIDQDDATLFLRFQKVLQAIGVDAPASEYDRVCSQYGGPGRKTLLRRLGLSWSQLKHKVVRETYDSEESLHYVIQQNEKLIKENAALRDASNAVLQVFQAEFAKIRPKPVKPGKRFSAKEMLDLHALRSDAHVGELVDSTLVQGLNEYNWKEYQRRVARWLDKILLFKEQDTATLGLNKLVLHLLGDQCTGENIYKGQKFAIDLHLANQFTMSVDVETSLILTLAQYFNEIEIFCVLGNHGRPGAKGDHAPRTNFDYLFYQMVARLLKDQPNVKMYISESPSMVVQHGDFVFIDNHGDAVNSWMGIPYYGKERQFRRLPQLYNINIDYELQAHHHQPSNLADKILTNGSLVGGSELSINRMTISSLPSQKIFYFHPKHGINRESNLYLADKVELKPDNNGIMTPYTQGEPHTFELADEIKVLNNDRS